MKQKLSNTKFKISSIRRRGFTLIELLVVIAIISGLSAILVPNFNAARERARDVQRKNDLKSLQKALELHKQDQSDSSYKTAPLPAVDTAWTGAAGTYVGKMPKDPVSGNGYYYNRTSSTTYTLCACLENKADPDGTTGNCAASYICSSGKSYVVNEP